MKTIRFFSFFLLALYLFSCAAVTAVKEDPAASSVITDLNFNDLIKSNSGNDVTSNLFKVAPGVLDTMVDNFFKDNKDNPEVVASLDSLSDDPEDKREVFETYYTTYADSLKQKLIDSGSIKIKPYESFLIDYFVPEKNKDTVYLANLFSATDKKGNTVSFEYQVLKDDQIFFEFENKKGKVIQEIKFVEGSETRYSYSNLSKKDNVIRGDFIVQTDNLLTLNILKNGFFKSLIRIKILKVPKNQGISFKEVDSIAVNKTVVEEVADTVYRIVEDQNFNLSSILDLSNKSNVNFPLLISGIDNLIGWGYWIGFNKRDTERYFKLSQTDPAGEPIISFAKAELTKTRTATFLPKSVNENIKFRFKPLQKETQSLNSSDNYAFFSRTNIIQFQRQ